MNKTNNSLAKLNKRKGEKTQIVNKRNEKGDSITDPIVLCLIKEHPKQYYVK